MFKYFKSEEIGKVPKEFIANSERTIGLLDEIRTHIGAPIKITSHYRSASHNKKVGGKEKSDHLKALAVDFTCGNIANVYYEIISNKEWMSRIRFISYYRDKNFIHISLK